VSDLNNIYIEKGNLQYKVVDGAWIDMGTFDALLDASVFIRNKKKQNNK